MPSLTLFQVGHRDREDVLLESIMLVMMTTWTAKTDTETEKHAMINMLRLVTHATQAGS